MGVFVGPNSPSPGTDFEAKSDRIGFSNRSSDPSPASAGDVYYNTSENKLKLYNGSAWENVGGGAQGTTFVDDGNSTPVFVPTICNTITIMGVARGGDGASPNGNGGGGGGGGGASNLSGYDVDGAPLRGATILVTTSGDAIVYSGSGTPSPKIFHAQAGENGNNHTPFSPTNSFHQGGTGGEGGTMAVGPGTAGGDGGEGGDRYLASPNISGTAGSPGGCGGGGGGGGYGNAEPERLGGNGGAGGNASVPGSLLTPNGTGPFAPFSAPTAQPGLSGGSTPPAGSNNAHSYRTGGHTDNGPKSFPLGSEGGKVGGGSAGAGAGAGGGAGGGIVFNGNAYGGGGGGTGSGFISNGGGEGGGAFILLQFS